MKEGAKPGMLWIERVGNRRSWAILARYFSGEKRGHTQRKKKGAKKKENGGLWKLTPLMEIRSQRGFPQRLGKHKTLSTVPTRPDGDSTDLIHQQGGAKSNDQKGPNQVDGSSSIKSSRGFRCRSIEPRINSNELGSYSRRSWMISLAK